MQVPTTQQCTKAPGNFMLQRSITDATGPYTTVQTIAPGNAGSFNDREARTNNWKNVFYRLVSENSIKQAVVKNSATQAGTSNPTQ